MLSLLKAKRFALTNQGLFFLVFCLMIGSGYSLSIPLFSIYLILIDAAIDLILEHNFIKQLLFTTAITINKNDNYISIAKNILNYQYEETFNYNKHIHDMPETFLTIPEQNWLQTEIITYKEMSESSLKSLE